MARSFRWNGRSRYGTSSSWCATTTYAVRAAILRSQASLATLSKEFGINAKRVAKWRKRASVEDLKTGPREVVLQAKAAGILNTIAHQTHFGYSSHGNIQDEGGEVLNPSLTMCVELVALRQTLETFCQTHGEILAGKVIIYKHIERWQVLSGISADAE